MIPGELELQRETLSQNKIKQNTSSSQTEQTFLKEVHLPSKHNAQTLCITRDTENKVFILWDLKEGKDRYIYSCFNIQLDKCSNITKR